MVMLSKNKTKKNKTKKNKTKKNKIKKNKIKKNKTKKNKYNQIGKGKTTTQSKRSIAKGSITKSKSTLKQTGRYDQKTIFQHMLERVCGKRPSDKCRISFIEQNKGCLGINWGREHKGEPHGFVYLENFGKPINQFGLKCKLPKGRDAMFEGNRYLHFDFNSREYCCKTTIPPKKQARRWILEYGLPGVNELGLEYDELVDLRNNLNNFINNPSLFDQKQLTADTIKLIDKFEKFDDYGYKLKKFSEQFNALADFNNFKTQFFRSFDDKYEGEDEDTYQNIYKHITDELLDGFKKSYEGYYHS